jgi:hypothetical protein
VRADVTDLERDRACPFRVLDRPGEGADQPEVVGEAGEDQAEPEAVVEAAGERFPLTEPFETPLEFAEPHQRDLLLEDRVEDPLRPFPALGEAPERLDVLFTSGNGGLDQVPGVAELQLRGQVQYHAVNLTLLDVGGPGKHLFGVGTTEHDTGTGFRHAPGALGGPATGPEPGALGDWLAPCCDLR